MLFKQIKHVHSLEDFIKKKKSVQINILPFLLVFLSKPTVFFRGYMMDNQRFLQKTLKYKVIKYY